MKGVALQTSVRGHYIDHLGTAASLLQIPYLFVDESEYLIAKRYYPGIVAECVDWKSTFPSKIAEEYDAVFCCQGIPKSLFQDLYGEHVRQIFVPHGNSDKGQIQGDLDIFKEPDCVFIYGNRMMEFLKERNIFQDIQRSIVTGNIRYSFYLQHQEFYDKLVQEDIFCKLDPNKMTVLYAPTWESAEACFFDAYTHVLDEIPEDFQVIVKLHPNFMDDYLAEMTRILWRYENRKDILFLHEYPLIYPVLARCDAYIGDLSSVGYDFLAFNRPMVFLNKYRQEFYLHQCGDTLRPWEFHEIYERLRKPKPLHETRRQVYLHTFGEYKPFEDLQCEIKKALL